MNDHFYLQVPWPTLIMKSRNVIWELFQIIQKSVCLNVPKAYDDTLMYLDRECLLNTSLPELKLGLKAC